jgi:hypothetical protein
MRIFPQPTMASLFADPKSNLNPPNHEHAHVSRTVIFGRHFLAIKLDFNRSFSPGMDLASYTTGAASRLCRDNCFCIFLKVREMQDPQGRTSCGGKHQ